jgi:glycerophosphoryl diester phosphodiesterase
MKKTLILLLLGLLAGCTNEHAEPEPDPPVFKSDLDISHIRIIAHRGVSRYAPENSLKAIVRAIEIGADAVEFDIRLSSDGEMMISHDDDLMRMTGKPGRIGDYKANELKTFRLKDKKGQFSNETIPSLQEVLDAAGGKITCLIEIKEESDELDRKLCDMLAGYDMDYIQVISFYGKSLKNVHRLDSGIPLGMLLWDPKYPSVFSAPPEEYSHIRSMITDYKGTSLGNLARLRELAGNNVYVYTLNNYNDLSAGCYQYIDGIITDEPEAWLSLKKAK